MFRLMTYADASIPLQAFIVASTSSEEDMLQFYKDHVVWSKEEIESLVSKGLFGRLYTPQVRVGKAYNLQGTVEFSVDNIYVFFHPRPRSESAKYSAGR
jgi:hypothetical protein